LRHDKGLRYPADPPPVDSPDVDGVFTVGSTREETETRMAEALGRISPPAPLLLRATSDSGG